MAGQRFAPGVVPRTSQADARTKHRPNSCTGKINFERSAQDRNGGSGIRPVEKIRLTGQGTIGNTSEGRLPQCKASLVGLPRRGCVHLEAPDCRSAKNCLKPLFLCWPLLKGAASFHRLRLHNLNSTSFLDVRGHLGVMRNRRGNMAILQFDTSRPVPFFCKLVPQACHMCQD